MGEEEQHELLMHLNATPHLLSYLWDVGLMPEQLKKGSEPYWFMIGILHRDKNAEKITNMEHHI